MARYKVDKSRYAELLIGTTITSCSNGTEEIMLDTDSDKDLILIIDKTGSFLRIHNNDTIIVSSRTLFPESDHEQFVENDEIDYNALLEAHTEEADRVMNDSIVGKQIIEVNINDFDLMIQFENGIVLEAFKSRELEDNLPHISLLCSDSGSVESGGQDE